MNFLLFLIEVPVKHPELADVWKYVIIGLVGTLSTYAMTKIEEAREKRRERRKEQTRLDNTDTTLRHNNEIQRSIKEILVQIQGYTECSRASLYNYHNGTKTHYGYSMNFVSIVEEKTDGIVVPLIDTFQRVPAAIFRPVLERIDESEFGHTMIRKEDLPEDDRLIMDKYQYSVCYHFKIGNSVWEGVVELAWVNKTMILSDSEVDHVQDLVNNISDLQRRLIKP
jgi:hypothetical protein